MNALETLARRVLNAIGCGRVTTGNDSGNVQLLQVQLSASELKDDIPRLAEFGFTSMPPVGSDVLVVFMGRDRSNGAIVATNHQASRMKNLKSGEVAIFDDQGQSIYLTRSGIVIDGGGMPISIANSPTVSIAGDLEVAGTVTAPFVVGTTNVTFGGKSGISHMHSDVENGPNNSGPPT
ncbi:MAG: phage baseplate assembly protein V [Janthinobacterium lividum]